MICFPGTPESLLWLITSILHLTGVMICLVSFKGVVIKLRPQTAFVGIAQVMTNREIWEKTLSPNKKHKAKQAWPGDSKDCTSPRSLLHRWSDEPVILSSPWLVWQPPPYSAGKERRSSLSLALCCWNAVWSQGQGPLIQGWLLHLPLVDHLPHLLLKQESNLSTSPVTLMQVSSSPPLALAVCFICSIFSAHLPEAFVLSPCSHSTCASFPTQGLSSRALQGPPTSRTQAENKAGQH